MHKISFRAAFSLSCLLLVSLVLLACGDNTPTAAPAGATTAPAPTTAPATTAAPAANSDAATATPVVLANLPTATPRPTGGAPTVVATVAPLISAIPPTAIVGTRPATTPQPIPTYSPSPTSSFNLKSSADYNLNPKTILRLTNLAGLPTLLDTPGTEPGLAVVADSWKLSAPLLWCEDTPANLIKVWGAFTFTLTVDEQPVDLKAYKTVDFDDDGAACRVIDLALGTTPPGTHRIEVTRRVNQEVDSALLKTKLATGEYTYQIAVVSLAANPNAAQNAKIADFKLGTSSGSDRTYINPAQSFSFLSDTIEQYKPGTFKYTAIIPAGAPVGLLGGWCAKDQTTLDENWQKMSYSATINGQAVDLKGIPTLDRVQGNQNCRLWDLNMTPPEGQHKIVIKINFSADTNDGIGTYQAGDYISEYTVLSLRLSANP